MPNALSDDEDAVDEPFEALKTIMENNEAKKAESRQAREQVEREEIEEISTDEPAAPAPTPLINTLKPDLAPDPDDTFPVNTRVQVWWEDPGAWYSSTVNSTQVWRGEKGKSRNPTRQIEVCYDDDATLTHSLHNNKVRKCEEMPSHELMPPSNPTSPQGRITTGHRRHPGLCHQTKAKPEPQLEVLRPSPPKRHSPMQQRQLGRTKYLGQRRTAWRPTKSRRPVPCQAGRLQSTEWQSQLPLQK